MKRITNYTVALFIILLVTSCATTEPNQSDRATDAMDKVQELSKEIVSQLDETEASLNNLTNQSNTDIGDALSSFRDNVETIVDMHEDFQDLSDEMISESNEYLSEWRKEETDYRNPELRRASEERRRDLNNYIDRINEDSGQVTRTLNEYIRDIEEIRSYLSKDPTAKGVSAVSSLNKNVEENGKRTRDAIQNLQSSISSAKSELGRSEVG